MKRRVKREEGKGGRMKETGGGQVFFYLFISFSVLNESSCQSVKLIQHLIELMFEQLSCVCAFCALALYTCIYQTTSSYT